MTNIQMTNDKNNRMTNIQNPNVKTEKKYFLFLSFEHLTFDIRHLTFVIRPAQSMLEYCLFIALILAALAGMQTYGKRGLAAALKSTADKMGMQQAGESGYNATQSLFLQAVAPANVSGENIMAGYEQKTLKNRQYNSTKVSTTTTQFSGTSGSDVSIDAQANAPLSSLYNATQNVVVDPAARVIPGSIYCWNVSGASTNCDQQTDGYMTNGPVAYCTLTSDGSGAHVPACEWVPLAYCWESCNKGAVLCSDSGPNQYCPPYCTSSASATGPEADCPWYAAGVICWLKSGSGWDQQAHCSDKTQNNQNYQCRATVNSKVNVVDCFSGVAKWSINNNVCYSLVNSAMKVDCETGNPL